MAKRRERQVHQKWLLATFRRYRESDSEPLETFVRAFQIPVIALNHLRRVPAFDAHQWDRPPFPQNGPLHC
jgi:hypothetical protein